MIVNVTGHEVNVIVGSTAYSYPASPNPLRVRKRTQIAQVEGIPVAYTVYEKPDFVPDSDKIYITSWEVIQAYFQHAPQYLRHLVAPDTGKASAVRNASTNNILAVSRLRGIHLGG